ncbi:hypothetical protein ACFFRR_001769 [Megaselia abdita]
MTRFVLFLAGFVLATVLAAETKPQGVQRLAVVENVKDYLSSHPGLRAIPLQRTFTKNARSGNLIRYSLGGRSKYDRLVAEEEQQFKYPNLHDVSVQMTYPEKGSQGAMITFVEILAEQSSDIGNAYVVSGGIGQRFISMVVEAKQTQFFEFDAKVYGQ